MVDTYLMNGFFVYPVRERFRVRLAWARGRAFLAFQPLQPTFQAFVPFHRAYPGLRLRAIVRPAFQALRWGPLGRPSSAGAGPARKHLAGLAGRRPAPRLAGAGRVWAAGRESRATVGMESRPTRRGGPAIWAQKNPGGGHRGFAGDPGADYSSSAASFFLRASSTASWMLRGQGLYFSNSIE